MKKLAAALFAAGIIFGSTSAFAVDPSLLIEDAGYYTAKLYYCDAYRSKIVLRDVKPTGNDSEIKSETAMDAEYTEIDISGNGKFSDGVEIEPVEFNRYADSNVGVIITRNASDGLRVVALRFI